MGNKCVFLIFSFSFSLSQFPAFSPVFLSVCNCSYWDYKLSTSLSREQIVLITSKRHPFKCKSLFKLRNLTTWQLSLHLASQKSCVNLLASVSLPASVGLEGLVAKLLLKRWCLSVSKNTALFWLGSRREAAQEDFILVNNSLLKYR